ncbi:hypothetical protein F6R98_05365 [Candidatus Methylospira mobilis]|uniref:Uncharacterized protein n=1 Tax=Candidatus Methylospira mobilis TaxID=1808979 RepID=A0A5Q0BIY5_9GAMM|nr:hypothetical protein [Candidatus Methylospira mobilis]QFY42127.1 hypothetical protein F6R98_05365 [Candidatus Methylospira mobilis]WNV03140.1 hypothetical protein RP726_11735 [Candidatus Methylospira mobilis]
MTNDAGQLGVPNARCMVLRLHPYAASTLSCCAHTIPVGVFLHETGCFQRVDKFVRIKSDSQFRSITHYLVH